MRGTQSLTKRLHGNGRGMQERCKRGTPSQTKSWNMTTSHYGMDYTVYTTASTVTKILPWHGGERLLHSECIPHLNHSVSTVSKFSTVHSFLMMSAALSFSSPSPFPSPWLVPASFKPSLIATCRCMRLFSYAADRTAADLRAPSAPSLLSWMLLLFSAAFLFLYLQQYELHFAFQLTSQCWRSHTLLELKLDAVPKRLEVAGRILRGNTHKHELEMM
jgi:hypothetical protein